MPNPFGTITTPLGDPGSLPAPLSPPGTAYKKKKKKPLSTGIYSSIFPKAGVTPPKTSPGIPPPAHSKSWEPPPQRPGRAAPETPGPGAVPAPTPAYLRPLDKATARKKAAQNLWRVWWA